MKKLILTFLLVLNLSASEIDQFSDREKYQDDTFDFTEILNLYTNDLIEKAVHNYNDKYGRKRMSQKDIHQRVAFEIFKVTAGSSFHRFGFHIPKKLTLLYAVSKIGLGPIQTWIMEQSNDLYWTHESDNIYSDTQPDAFNKNFVIKVGGEFMGPDKIDHFLDQGYTYWVRSGYGQDDLKAKKFGVGSEYGWFGLNAGGVASFADLRANWGGYQFYKYLFSGEESYLLVSDLGKVSIRRGFDWAEHIDWQFDELKNPSLYKKETMDKIMNYIKKDLGRYCKTYRFLESRDFFNWSQEREDFYLTEGLELMVPHPFDIRELCE